MGITTEIVRYDDLSEDEAEFQPDNGMGKEFSSYLRVYHNGEIIDTYSSAMEPEDVQFYRDLSWVSHAIEDAYARGHFDASQAIGG